jgi:hypothetical protein
MEKKVRFGDLVRSSGRPQTVALWEKPENNPALARAIKQNRVLTVVQEVGKKDHGLIGFQVLSGAVYLVFPRPLPKEPNARVVGLNYQLIEEPPVPESQRVKSANPRTTPKSSKTTPPRAAAQPAPPVSRKFTVRVRRTARQEIDIDIMALDRDAAEGQALDRARKKPFKVLKEDVQAEVVKSESSTSSRT